MRPRAVLLALAAAAAALPPPAHAIPPLVLTGQVRVLPGLPSPVPVAVSFTGTGTDGDGAVYSCSFSGTADTVTGYVALDTAPASTSGTCGPYSWSDCLFELTPTTWTFQCGSGGGGTFGVQAEAVNPTRGGAAAGTVV